MYIQTNMPSQDTAPHSPASPRRVVLLVDDDAPVLGMVALALEHLGYETLKASSATEALLLMEQRPAIDLVLTDVRMPEMSGFDLALCVREQHPDVKLLFYTGATRASLAHPLIALTDDNYLIKPLSIAQLKDKVDRLFRD